jgi:hypothetical protein
LFLDDTSNRLLFPTKPSIGNTPVGGFLVEDGFKNGIWEFIYSVFTENQSARKYFTISNRNTPNKNILKV